MAEVQISVGLLPDPTVACHCSVQGGGSKWAHIGGDTNDDAHSTRSHVAASQIFRSSRSLAGYRKKMVRAPGSCLPA